MALKAIRRLQLLGQTASSLATGLRRASRLPGAAVVGEPPCAACLWTCATRCARRQGCVKEKRSLSTIVKDPSVFTTTAGSAVGLHRDSSGLRFRLTQTRPLQPGGSEEERAFQERLDSCSSSRQVLRLLRSVEAASDWAAVAALHRVADLERDGEGRALRDPSVLEADVLEALCQQLEQHSGRLSDAGLASALLACTRLYVDPWSTLVVRLVSESQGRLAGGRMALGELCHLGRAMLALEGPGCGMLEQVMEQVRRRGEPEGWSLGDLAAVYGLLGDGLGEGGRHQDLLNAMHAQAVVAAPRMGPAEVSGVLGALVALEQAQAMPLVIALCKQAVRHVPRLGDGELSAVLGALMHFGHSDRYFVEAMERRAPQMAFAWRPETVSKVAQYFGRRNILSPAVLDAVAESFVYRADEYTTGQVARQIVPFGRLGYLPPNAGQLFRKVEAVLHSRFAHFQPHTLLGLLHSCTLVERFPVNFLSKVFNRYFLQQLQEQGTGTGMDRTALAQLTQLYMTVKLECPFYEGPKLLPKYRVKSFLTHGQALETPVDGHLYNHVKNGLVDLLGARTYFASRLLTPYCYTLDVEIKLDEEGYVLPASHSDDIHKRIALCIDGHKRFTVNSRQLLGKESIKQRHLRLLGYEVVQIPYYEFEKLRSKTETVEYLHKKIFPHSYRLSW